jgi:hypothetical protein
MTQFLSLRSPFRHDPLCRTIALGPIPAELGQLNDLTAIALAHNILTGPIPAELGDLENLDVLQLSGNELSGIPPPLFNRKH